MTRPLRNLAYVAAIGFSGGLGGSLPAIIREHGWPTALGVGAIGFAALLIAFLLASWLFEPQGPGDGDHGNPNGGNWS